MSATVISINISDKKGMRKKSVSSATIKENFGIEGDAHASEKWHRQISLLALDSIKKMQSMGLNVTAGDFAENITTEGIDLPGLPVGTKMSIGEDVEVEVSQIGKICHTRCAIYNQAGDCVMPKEGIFVKVLKGGTVKKGDTIKIRRQKKMIKVAVLTLSDKGSKGKREDKSGPLIEKLVKKISGKVVSHNILPDEKAKIKKKLLSLCSKVDLILTTGGTGLSPRDVTPDATLEVLKREIPGIAEAMRYKGLKKTPHAMISRAVAGVRGKTLIINLPGSPAAVKENLGVILPALSHAIEKIKGSKKECASHG